MSERAPDRAFRATLAVPPRRGGAYFLARTEPRLGRERHDALAALLAQAAGGAEAGLPRFVAAVRRAFVEECEGGGAEGAEAGAAVG